MSRPAQSLAPASLVRRVACGAAVLGAVATTTVALAPAALAAEVSVPLSYSCAFPTGTSVVDVVISATLPDTATAGDAVAVDDVTAEVTVPRSAYGAVAILGATSIEGTASASATITDGAGTAQTVTSDALTVPSTPLPASGDLVVVASGAFPAVAVEAAGTATIVVTDSFSARLTPKTASGGNTLLGTFTVPCTLVAGQDATLGTVEVR